MNLRRYLKGWLTTHPGVYRFYTRIRYGAHTEVRDWVLRVQRFMREKNLNTFIFESDTTYVRIESGHEFKYVPEQMGGLLGLEFKHGFESEDIRSVLNLLPANPVVIDIGANFGIYSVLIASSSGDCQVHAFEPVPQTAALLKSNADRNRVGGRIIINNVAVGSEPGNLLITTDRYAGNYLLAHNNYHGDVQEVPVIRLDDYVAQKGLRRIDFIKCDVEGAELLVMKGAGHVLASMRPIIMLEIAEEWTRRFDYSADDLKAHMSEAGYECKHGAEVAAELRLNAPGDSHTHNYFFFPKE
jgi:FkbM family methyltransferase